ncbi:MAG: FAD-dependent monooxygenase [Acidobacteria bacterium]|nr:FAD-dependent monooxygenase [Acidobacteriota bacterium]
MPASGSLSTDVFIVGGGPAGLAAAIAARRKGLRVAVADCAAPPVDKSCGEGLLPDAVACLGRLGVTMREAVAYPFAGIRFVDGDSIVEAVFPYAFGLGIRRTVLHRTLLRCAAEAQVETFWGSAVERDASGQLTLAGREVDARWIIGADGHNSRVRRWAGLDANDTRVRFGFRRHFQLQPWSDCVEVYWGPSCQIVVTPVSATEVSLALLSSDAKMRLPEALLLFPDLHARVRYAAATTSERGAITAMLPLESVCCDPFALVGDASGSVDAITGEGLCLAFQQAEKLAEALAANDLRLYDAAHRAIMRRPRIMSRLMLSMDSRDALRHWVMRRFEARPQLFSIFLAAHLGVFPRSHKRELDIEASSTLPNPNSEATIPNRKLEEEPVERRRSTLSPDDVMLSEAKHLL